MIFGFLSDSLKIKLTFFLVNQLKNRLEGAAFLRKKRLQDSNTVSQLTPYVSSDDVLTIDEGLLPLIPLGNERFCQGLLGKHQFRKQGKSKTHYKNWQQQ